MLVAGSASAEGGPLGRFYRGYPSDTLEPVSGRIPETVRVLPPEGPSAWAEPLRASLESRIRGEWPMDRTYGPVQTSVLVWLTHPLVTGRDGATLLVPATASERAFLRGGVEIPEPPGPRRIVVLVDASSSANARTLPGQHRRDEAPTVLEAERSALRHLLRAFFSDPTVEIGLIGYGETTWPIAPPGTAPAEIRRRLERWESEVPRGRGRTDLVCALATARDWLEDAPDGFGREVLLLTDGDLPHSGRFVSCRGAGGRRSETCEARRNRAPCPASHTFRAKEGRSDLIQLDRLARRSFRGFKVYPVVFDAGRPARPYADLARTTGGELYRVPSADALDRALPALVARRVTRVRAVNETTGQETGDLLDRESGTFEGSLDLAPGANDVLLRVEGSTGPAALHRFRIYAAGDHLRRTLADLRERNRALEEKLAARRPTLLPRAPTRTLEIRPDPTD